jgi:hypothetical protein
VSDTLTPYISPAPTRPVDVIGAQRLAEDRAANMLPSSTQAFSPELSALLRELKPGQRIRITQTVRVGQTQWDAVVTGTFRAVKYLSTGLATERIPEDAIVVVSVHFTKDNGELSSVTLDEHSRIEVIP